MIMKFMYYYLPIFLPHETGGGNVYLDIKYSFALLIVSSIMWLIMFAIILIINWANKNPINYKTLVNNDLFLFVSFMFGMIDAVSILIILCSWVSILI